MPGANPGGQSPWVDLKPTSHGSKYFAHRHTLGPWGGVKRSFFSESGNDAYQIKVKEL